MAQGWIPDGSSATQLGVHGGPTKSLFFMAAHSAAELFCCFIGKNINFASIFAKNIKIYVVFCYVK